MSQAAFLPPMAVRMPSRPEAACDRCCIQPAHVRDVLMYARALEALLPGPLPASGVFLG